MSGVFLLEMLTFFFTPFHFPADNWNRVWEWGAEIMPEPNRLGPKLLLLFEPVRGHNCSCPGSPKGVTETDKGGRMRKKRWESYV